MAKHPTPKQKKNSASGRSQYSTFARIARRKLSNATPVVKCEHCKQPKVNHRICPNCGYYAGKKSVGTTSPLDKVTKIKA